MTATASPRSPRPCGTGAPILSPRTLGPRVRLLSPRVTPRGEAAAYLPGPVVSKNTRRRDVKLIFVDEQEVFEYVVHIEGGGLFLGASIGGNDLRIEAISEGRAIAVWNSSEGRSPEEIVQVGDMITEVDGKPVESIKGLQEATEGRDRYSLKFSRYKDEKAVEKAGLQKHTPDGAPRRTSTVSAALACAKYEDPFNLETPKRKSMGETAKQVLRSSVQTKGSIFTEMGPSWLRERHSVLAPDGTLAENYAMNEIPIGRGSFGRVCKAKHNKTGEKRAIKTIPIYRVKDMTRFETELDISRRLLHKNIVRLFEEYRDEHCVHLVMELCTGGDLFDMIQTCKHYNNRRGIPLPRVAKYIWQMLAGISYCHFNRFAHRDIKPENYLIQSLGILSNLGSLTEVAPSMLDKAVLKLCDFGLASEFEKGVMLTERVGTPYYIAPEVLGAKYNNKCDIWSIGVCCYMCCVGYPPFNGFNDKVILDNVQKGEWSFRENDWSQMGPMIDDTQDFIKTCMIREIKDRPDAKTLMKMNHWLRRHGRDRESGGLCSCFGGGEPAVKD